MATEEQKRTRRELEQREFELSQRFRDLIRDPDPIGMVIAQDLILANRDVTSLVDVGEDGVGGSAHHAGRFVISPLNPADAPLVAAGWTIETKGRNWTAKYETYRYTIEYFWQNERKLIFSGKEQRTLEGVLRTAAADAWALVKWLKTQPASTPMNEIEDGADAAVRDIDDKDDTPKEVYDFQPRPSASGKVKKRTYVEAQDDALLALSHHGWALSPRDLATPYADSPNGAVIRLYFKPQAVWASVLSDERGIKRHSLKTARSLSMNVNFPDIREMNGSEFVAKIHQMWPKTLGKVRANPQPRVAPTLTLHTGYTTIELAVTVHRQSQTNYFHTPPTTSSVLVLRAKNGPYSFSWNADDLVNAEDQVAVAGDMYVTGMLPARDWALEQYAGDLSPNPAPRPSKAQAVEEFFEAMRDTTPSSTDITQDIVIDNHLSVAWLGLLSEEHGGIVNADAVTLKTPPADVMLCIGLFTAMPICKVEYSISRLGAGISSPAEKPEFYIQFNLTLFDNAGGHDNSNDPSGVHQFNERIVKHVKSITDINAMIGQAGLDAYRMFTIMKRSPSVDIHGFRTEHRIGADFPERRNEYLGPDVTRFALEMDYVGRRPAGPRQNPELRADPVTDFLAVMKDSDPESTEIAEDIALDHGLSLVDLSLESYAIDREIMRFFPQNLATGRPRSSLLHGEVGTGNFTTRNNGIDVEWTITRMRDTGGWHMRGDVALPPEFRVDYRVDVKTDHPLLASPVRFRVWVIGDPNERLPVQCAAVYAWFMFSEIKRDPEIDILHTFAANAEGPDNELDGITMDPDNIRALPRINQGLVAFTLDRATDVTAIDLGGRKKRNPAPEATHMPWNQLRANPSLISNPAWVTRTLARTFEAMEAKVPAKWLPRLEDVQPASAGIRGTAKELGCGSYGCVLPTLDPKVVLKVTTDETEAEFAAKLGKTLVSPVVVTYELAMSVPGAMHDGRKIFLLWREDASEVGGLTGKADELVDEQHQQAQLCYELLHGGITGDELHEALDGWEQSLEDMAKNPALTYVATGMLANFRELGIGLFDVHAGNLGKCMRDGKAQWIVIDPGHVAVIRNRSA